jgi:hypothetical protein
MASDYGPPSRTARRRHAAGSTGFGTAGMVGAASCGFTGLGNAKPSLVGNAEAGLGCGALRRMEPAYRDGKARGRWLRARRPRRCGRNDLPLFRREAAQVDWVRGTMLSRSSAEVLWCAVREAGRLTRPTPFRLASAARKATLSAGLNDPCRPPNWNAMRPDSLRPGSGRPLRGRRSGVDVLKCPCLCAPVYWTFVGH